MKNNWNLKGKINFPSRDFLVLLCERICERREFFLYFVHVYSKSRNCILRGGRRFDFLSSSLKLKLKLKFLFIYGAWIVFKRMTPHVHAFGFIS